RSSIGACMIMNVPLQCDPYEESADTPTQQYDYECAEGTELLPIANVFVVRDSPYALLGGVQSDGPARRGWLQQAHISTCARTQSHSVSEKTGSCCHIAEPSAVNLHGLHSHRQDG